MVLSRVRVAIGQGRAWLASRTSRLRTWWARAEFQKHLFAAVLIGFAIRAVLIPITSESDLINNAEPALTMAYGGGPYTFSSVYPPFWPVLLNLEIHVTGTFYPLNDVLRSSPLLVALNAQVGYIQPSYLAGPAFLVAEKAPIVVFDLLTGLLLFRITEEVAASRELASRVFTLWWLCPLIVVESSVHGAYDVMPAFFALASVYLVSHGRNLGAGLAIGSGVFLKAFPIFLVPLLLVVLLRRGNGAAKRIFWSTGQFVVGLATVAFLALAPGGVFRAYLLPELSSSYPGSSTFGGFGLLGPLSWSAFQPTAMWFSDHTQALTTFLTFLAIAIAVLIAWLYYRTGSTSLLTRPGLWAIALTISATYLSLPFVQPQYLVWILPWLALLLILHGEARIAYGVLSTIPILDYLVGLGGPLYFFETPALFWGHPSLAWLLSQLTYWRPLAPLLLELATIPTFVAALLLWWQGSRGLSRAPRSTPT